MCLAEGREGPPSPKSVTRKSLGRNTVHGRSGSRRKKEKQKSDEEEEQTNGNGTEKGMLMMMMTKKRMEKTRQGKTNDKWRIIVSDVPVAKNEVAKGLMMMLISAIENGNEE
jgi:DNA-binding transcriptional regulator PaaX